MKTFAISNQKGGVNKTTITITLGYALSVFHNKRTLLVDLDSQKHTTSGYLHEIMPIQKENTLYSTLMNKTPIKVYNTRIPNLKVAASHIALARVEGNLVGKKDAPYRIAEALRAVQNEFDVVLIDCPPSLGFLLVNALTAADYVIIPISHEGFEDEGLEDLLDTYRKVRTNYNDRLRIGGFIQTVTTPHTLCKRFREHLIETYPGKVFNASIPRTVAMQEARDKRQIIFEYHTKPESKLQAARDSYAKFAQELITKFNI